MTSKEALGYLEDIAYGRKMNYSPYELTQIVKKDLEVLSILKKHIKEDNFMVGGLVIENIDLSKKEIEKIGEWLKDDTNR